MSLGETQHWEPVEIVRRWTIAAGLASPAHPTLDVDSPTRELACSLIEEETAEFRVAVEAGDLVEIADAVADLLWVTLEAALTFGIPVEPVFAEVSRSNFTKVSTNQITRNAAGKIVKGSGYSAPDILPILRAHGYRPASALPAPGGDRQSRGGTP